jgi:hypothetical protein
MTRLSALVVCISLAAIPSPAQSVAVREAFPTGMPVLVDSNSPVLWRDGRLSVFTSTGSPLLANVANQFEIEWGSPGAVEVDTQAHYPMWIESVWQDDDGVVYAWYHHEPGGVCGGSILTAPQIGALRSFDGGRSFQDLGIVLASGERPDCNARNGFFAGGHGDFTVIPDRARSYFYFLFGNYGGVSGEQGVAIARMALEDRDNPAGDVWKYHDGSWNQPGLGGHMTPVFAAEVPWQHVNAQAYWGPSVHWNTRLESFVVLLNHSCCEPYWRQEGIYLSLNPDLSNPAAWTVPTKILRSEHLPFGAGFYPQVIGLGPGESDSFAGSLARLYINGYSRWILEFTAATDAAPPPATVPEAEPEPAFAAP